MKNVESRFLLIFVLWITFNINNLNTKWGNNVYIVNISHSMNTAAYNIAEWDNKLVGRCKKPSEHKLLQVTARV